MMTKWIAVILCVLVCRVGADFPCKTDQIHWKLNSTLGKRYKCLECPDCPAGSQPSVPCGTSVRYSTAVHCVPCQLSKTFSNRYDKAQCKACTVCSPGKAVIKNCTLSSNTECDDKCARGYYSVPFIFTCLPCTECCKNGKDEFAKECENYRKKCKVPSTPCRRVNTTPSTTMTTVSQKTSTALQTTHLEKLKSEIATMSGTKIVKQTSSVTPNLSRNNRQVDGGDRAVTSEEDDGGTKTLETLVIVCAVIAMLAILALILFIVFGGRISHDTFKCHWNRNSNNDNEVDASQLKPLTSASQEQLNQDDMTLEQLENDQQPLFDWMCLKLDNGRWWFRRDYERLAAKYNRIPLEVRNALQAELQSQRSPSKMLMGNLQTKYPSLPLRHFVGTLLEIGRNDIAQRIMPHLKKNVNSLPA